jgi:hypothetical protein
MFHFSRRMDRFGISTRSGSVLFVILFTLAMKNADANPKLQVRPVMNLTDGRRIRISLSGANPGGVYLAVQCGPKALTLLQDGCENRCNAILFVNSRGEASGILRVHTILSTASGPVDCQTEPTFLAVVSLFNPPMGKSLLLQRLRFSPGNFHQRSDHKVIRAIAPQMLQRSSNRVKTPIMGKWKRITPDSPWVHIMDAGMANSVSSLGLVTGPYSKPLLKNPLPPSPMKGEGLLRLALSAPKTSWGPGRPTSVVISVSVDDGVAQQMVLFYGSSPFIYAGFTRPIKTGKHKVIIRVEPNTGASASTVVNPVVELMDCSLEVVPPQNPDYLAYAYAPVMFGRTTSALHDTPLLTYATPTPLNDGSVRLEYTVIWSHENAGTGFVPFLEWGEWGRMTDIENAIRFIVHPDGNVSDVMYLYGGEPLTGAPDSLTATSENLVPFKGAFYGNHPIIRVATGNNDFSDQGETGFRFQMAPVAPPKPDETREAAMDSNPWTYRIMGEEVMRWYQNISLNPRSPDPGDARQYAIIDIDSEGEGISSIAVGIQWKGRWFRNDFGSGYPLIGTGHVRTVVKMPMGWQSAPITGIELIVSPATAIDTFHLKSIRIIQLTSKWSLRDIDTPAPKISGGLPL